MYNEKYSNNVIVKDEPRKSELFVRRMEMITPARPLVVKRP
jgi:hypothetical protein